MRRLALFFILFLAAMAVNAQSFGSGTTVYVAAKSVKVKAATGFFANTLGTLNLGDAATVLISQGKWLMVRSSSGLQGWAASDAFSNKPRISGGTNAAVTDIALAGKGFNSNLEKLVSSGENIDFSGVDAMEKRAVPPDLLRSFLTEGRLAGGE